MKRSFILLVATVVTGGNVLFAQSVEQGKSFSIMSVGKVRRKHLKKYSPPTPII